MDAITQVLHAASQLQELGSSLQQLVSRCGNDSGPVVGDSAADLAAASAALARRSGSAGGASHGSAASGTASGSGTDVSHAEQGSR